MTVNAPVESKVLASTYATTAVSVAIAVLNDVHADSALISPLPAWVQSVLIAAAPPVVVFLSGWQAEHTPREEK